MKIKYNIALVAHDSCKDDLVEWVAFNKAKLKKHHLICTGTTGKLVEEEINRGIEPESRDYIRVMRLNSGPLGGDQQMGALVAEGKIDFMFFFWDTMTQQPHDVDVKALLRITVLYNVPTACCRATADFIISSELFENENYQHKIYSYETYATRDLKHKQ